MLTQPVPDTQTLATHILTTFGPHTVDGIDFGTAVAAARARHALATALVSNAHRVRDAAASPNPSRQPPHPVETDLSYTRCPWCTDYLERDTRAIQIGPFVLHANPCAMEFAAVRWTEPPPAPMYPKPRGRRHRPRTLP
jgi:hypothetical protein